MIAPDTLSDEFTDRFRAAFTLETDAVERPATAVRVKRPAVAPVAYDIDPPLALVESGILYEQRVVVVEHLWIGRKRGREFWKTRALSTSTPDWTLASLPGKLEPDELLRRMGYTVVEPGQVTP